MNLFNKVTLQTTLNETKSYSYLFITKEFLIPYAKLRARKVFTHQESQLHYSENQSSGSRIASNVSNHKDFN